ncbi:MAG: beta galactosidase jelly roll domain-containing protein [Clostridia bacterium]|nr:beta galactosidase jelly roll domain-containing protein [Clostridia bacterium]
MLYTPNAPRPEFPRPQFDRGDANWLNLNGPWEYRTDRGQTGEQRGFQNGAPFSETITVPFCRESELSGIGDVDFCDSVWYRKTLTLPEDWAGKRILFHIGACDYYTKVWVNGQYMGDHTGGYVAFSFDITKALKEGENTLTVGVWDHLRDDTQPGGKQSPRYESFGCFYTRTTGIWQTTWLECVPTDYIASTKYYPDIERQKLVIEALTVGGEGMTLTAKASYNGKAMGEGTTVVHGGKAVLEVELNELHLWEVGNGRLYDLTLTMGEDAVQSYFGMRKIECRDGFFYLNGRCVFQRLVLDQGFYPDGIYTASTLSELEADIDRSLAMGFNGARLHQKVFEPLFLSLCDKKGYIVWGEHANWGQDSSRESVFQNFLPEWCEILARDFNHPAIIGWCPLNETQNDQIPLFVKLLATVTRQYDTTRMYIDASGWTHTEGLTDIMDLHDYEQNPEAFAAKLAPLAEGGTYNVHWWGGPKDAMHTHPTFVSEYGGIRWAPQEAAGWGYGQAPQSEEECISRFKGLTEAILFHPKMGALCYTQLTDVEQEVNGLYTYHRVPKFDPAIMHAILTQKAAVED